MGNEPRVTGKIVAFRTFLVDVKIEAPSHGALNDYEMELRRKIRRAVNTQTAHRRHGVRVTPPGTLYRQSYSDNEFYVNTTAMPSSRRGARY
jgi:hypothetical protein